MGKVRVVGASRTDHGPTGSDKVEKLLVFFFYYSSNVNECVVVMLLENLIRFRGV